MSTTSMNASKSPYRADTFINSSNAVRVKLQMFVMCSNVRYRWESELNVDTALASNMTLMIDWLAARICDA